jgi:hypothetical protein
MRPAVLLLLSLAAVTASPPRNPEHETNVNSRYVIETIEVAPQFVSRFSSSLRDRIEKAVGAQFDQEMLDEISQRIRDELRNRLVVMKVSRGSKPDHVKVVFEISTRKSDGDIVVPRLIYHSRQNFSFGLDGNWTPGNHRLSAGILTDNDELIERYSGIRGGVGRHKLAAGHLNLDAEVESWRSQWNPAVQTALTDAPDVPGIYRTRVHFQPSATIVFYEPLTLQLGVSFERLQLQFPAARHELSSAAFTTLRFRRRWELTPVSRHEIDSHYDLRSATRTLDSDFVYTRHSASFQYSWRGRREEIITSFQGGRIYGRAPLFERFALGNSRTLRGWNKYDVDPLGGDRMIHGSFDYRFHWLRLIYDTGSAWRRGAPMKMRHSLAFGVTHKGPSGFSAMVAFPIREGSIDPVFITGINF